MFLKKELIAFIALGRYFMLRKAHYSDAYKRAFEETRLEYCPGYDKDDFLGDMTKEKNRIKKDGTMKFIFEKLREGKTFIQISQFLEKSNDLSNYPSSQEKRLALQHLEEIGGRDAANSDVLSDYELKLLGLA